MEFFRFEIARRLRQPMVYVFTLVNFLLIYAALNVDTITVGKRLPNVYANAPWVAQHQVMFMSLIGLLVTTAFMNTAAVRDFSSKFQEILFTKPISKIRYLGGRFLGALLMASIPPLGVLVAVWFTGFNLFDSVNVGPTIIAGYFWAFALFILPNTLFAGAITFSVASLTRSQLAGFVAALGLLVLYIVAGSLLGNLDSEYIAALIDPFGFRAFALETKYWTTVERNVEYLTFANPIITLNRILWIGVSLVILIGTYFKWNFSISGTTSKNKKLNTVKVDNSSNRKIEAKKDLNLPAPESSPSAIINLLYAVRTEVSTILTSKIFLIILAFSVLNMLGSILNVDEMYGTGNYPVTYLMIDAIRGSLYFFLGAIIMYYAGELVWRERDSKMAQLLDATPIATWIAPAAKFVALCIVPLIVLLGAILVGMSVQTIKGYTEFDIGQYVLQLIGLDWFGFVAFAGLALFLQTIINNKYLGYFAFLVVLLITTFGMNAIGVTNNLFIFAATPSTTYTAFNGLQPYLTSSIAYMTYWLLITTMLVVVAGLFWVRGQGHTRANRLELVKQRFDGSFRLFSFGIGLATVALGGFIYYQSSVLNEVVSEDQLELNAVNYENQYSRFAARPMPTITVADYGIDIYPHQRKLEAEINFELVNNTDRIIDTILFTKTADYTHEFELSATSIENLKSEFAEAYVLTRPLLPGEMLPVKITSRFSASGIENEVSNTGVVPNGTFVNNRQLAPRIGYQSSLELSENKKREEYGLSPKLRQAKLPEGHCSIACKHHYFGNDADEVQLSATVTTSIDQLAIAPGSLVSQHSDEASGRRTFRYEIEKPVSHFFSVLSGTYEVQRQKWGEVDLEVYHLAEHGYNVDKMMRSMRTSLEYYSKAFGPYPHKQARIIEFPRYGRFAQAFPGTMPYSEAIGFIADLKDSTAIDMVTYVVAHEMAHQWWGHQVVGADVQGATMLSETFAQYSALLVQEQFYGKTHMRKFLDHELDRYLRGRGTERRAELPLMLDEGQGYIHYRKGAVVMYALAEYVGRDSINAALSSFLQRFGGKGPNYPTSRQFVDEHLKPRVPDSLQYLITDWFETITLYNNRVLTASAKTSPTEEGAYEVTFSVQTEKFTADSLGAESPLSLTGDYIDVGIFAEPTTGGKTLGEPLWRERVKFDATQDRTFTITVNQKPAEVAIDPDALLIDRLSDDNRMDVNINDEESF